MSKELVVDTSPQQPRCQYRKILYVETTCSGQLTSATKMLVKNGKYFHRPLLTAGGRGERIFNLCSVWKKMDFGGYRCGGRDEEFKK